LTEDRFGNSNSAYSFDGVNNFIDSGSNILHAYMDWKIHAWISGEVGGSYYQAIYSETGIRYGDRNLKFALRDGILGLYLDTYGINDQ
jgi:hypothetical protein